MACMFNAKRLVTAAAGSSNDAHGLSSGFSSHLSGCYKPISRFFQYLAAATYSSHCAQISPSPTAVFHRFELK